ncbi:hypothetical protein M0802_016579 [Mischocyttarus mexicanus]|nr:hypothetical protein M0802_016581 [Mischocyttarus mexicanus]KAI4472685.1 hypothetical protein M0802_016579 [Mischocyttarus mexicanus]
MILKYAWLGLLLASIYLIYSENYFQTIWHFLPKELKNLMNIFSKSTKLELLDINTTEKIFTKDELKKYNNIENGLYLSILGQVFDVTKGAKHYEPGASYHIFVGCDASLAFITGEFDEKKITDDISELSPEKIKELDDWVQFYKTNYIYKGKLSGRYFNNDGTPTIESLKIQQKLIDAKKEIANEEKRKKLFPNCNIEWKANVGTTLWCSKRSGGIERDWIGVPRMYFEMPGSKQHRCACVNLNSKEYEENKGNFKEYSGCSTTSIKCNVK